MNSSTYPPDRANDTPSRSRVVTFLTRRRGGKRTDVTDWLTYLYLIAGVFVMFGPVVWLVMSSFKDESLLFEPNPTFLPYRQASTKVAGFDGSLKLYDVQFRDLLVGGALISVPDVRASNGVIQGLDSVILTSDLQDRLAALQPDSSAPAFPAPAEPVPLTGSEGTVLEALRADGRFSVMAQLVDLAGLDDSLSGDQRVTLLAPTDDAFAAFVQTLGADKAAALLLPANAALLHDLVATHIAQDRFLLVNLLRAVDQPLATLSGAELPMALHDAAFRRLAQVGSPQGAKYTMVDPAAPEQGTFDVFIYITPAGPSTELKPVREVYFNVGNYTGAVKAFDFWTYLKNSVYVTVAATVVTVIINSMAAFGLSKYKFAGREVIFLIIVGTLMVPVSVIMIPAFLVISKVGWVNSLWGLIVPGAATPTGVFLLRQYMLTIPDELLESARIDGASEWRIFWQIVMPLALPAIAVLAIFSVMWRWNDFLWPLIVVSRTDKFTLQVGLNAFQGALDVQWHYILAMTVLTLLPITVVFAFLQRFITSGIATTGMKG